MAGRLAAAAAARVAFIDRRGESIALETGGLKTPAAERERSQRGENGPPGRRTEAVGGGALLQH